MSLRKSLTDQFGATRPMSTNGTNCTQSTSKKSITRHLRESRLDVKRSSAVYSNAALSPKTMEPLAPLQVPLSLNLRRDP